MNPLTLLKCIIFLDLLAVGLVIPLLPAHVQQLGGSHIAVGALGTLYAGFQLFSGPLFGSLSDLQGRKFVSLLSLTVSACAYITLGLTTSVAVILLMRSVLGLFKQTQMLSRALVPDYEKNKAHQAEVYGRMAAISGLGMTIGPALGGNIADAFPEHGFTIIGLAAGTIFLLNAVLTSCLPPTTIHYVREEHDADKTFKDILFNIQDSIKQSVIEIFNIQWSKYWDIFMLKALVGFAMGVYYSNYSLYLISEFDLSKKHVGYIISFQGVVGSVSSYFMGYINNLYSNDKDYVIRNFHVFVLITGSFAGLLIAGNIYFYIVWLVPLAIGNAVARLVTLEMLLSRVESAHRGTLLGASNSVRSLTGATSSLVAGFIGHYAGLSYVIFGSLIPTTLGLMFSYHYLSSVKSKKN